MPGQARNLIYIALLNMRYICNIHNGKGRPPHSPYEEAEDLAKFLGGSVASAIKPPSPPT